VPRSGNWFGSFTTTSHSGPYGYLQDVPLVFYGPSFIASTGPLTPEREVTLADLPATLARLMAMDWPDRRGTAIHDVLRPTTRVPRLLVTVVIDGGGWNVLRRWPRSWPYLARLMDHGASVRGATVGSSPSITPAVHTTLATGVWPRRHGVMAIVARSDGGAIVSGFARRAYDSEAAAADPTVTLDVATLADEWDLATDNRAEVAMIAAQNFHVGMVGRGAALEGADRDIVAITDDTRWATNPRYYSLPRYVNTDVEGPARDLAAVDRSDGRADGRWRGHDFWRVDATPAYAPWQNRVAEALIEREGFGDDRITDLLYVNYKAPDAAGHRWNMIAVEQRDVLASVDDALRDLVGFLHERVGRNGYALVVTADHGQTPLDGDGWAISQAELKADVERRFGSGVIERTSTAIYFLDRRRMTSLDVSPEDVASFMTTYSIGDNVRAGDTLPRRFEHRTDEPVFAAVVPGRRLDRVRACARGPGWAARR
jgi:hypothetical protein